MRLRCPDWPQFTGDTIIGCGREFEQSTESIEDDPDLWADCPHCGIGFHHQQGRKGTD